MRQNKKKSITELPYKTCTVGFVAVLKCERSSAACALFVSSVLFLKGKSWREKKQAEIRSLKYSKWMITKP